MSTQEIAGKVALITGAAKNIGRSIALSLAEAGAAVAVNTLSSSAEAEKVAQEICAAGGQAEVFMADIADGAAVQSMVEGIIRRFGRLDILVLNASYRRETPFAEMTFEEWRRVMSITLDGSFHCIKASLPHLIRAGGGSIITLGGAKALSGSPGKVNGAAAKQGLVGMTRALAMELAAQGIRVNCVSPGPIATTRPSYRNKITSTAHIPLGRHGQPDEIAAMVRFLCGPTGAFITGQTLHVNGGTLLGT